MQQFKASNIVNNYLSDNALAAHQSVHVEYYGELIIVPLFGGVMVYIALWLSPGF
ncbi:hypothetical protein [Paraglaciecola arctica]|uniref:Uncharacterized protein n=1 Tax=Paraglaciecola arctica BSs20135 TaxID=493475 RepID=K6Z542_9ALTE|nr:hypothetical protein [Paraglaciecola arctica]GAC18550.1 hypothetical protein GARC_1578 [Paraglaciecola arctica BSs20135]